MEQGTAKRKACDVRKAEIYEMENERPTKSAERAFHFKPYQVHQSVEQYIANKCGTRVGSGRDAKA